MPRDNRTAGLGRALEPQESRADGAILVEKVTLELRYETGSFRMPFTLTLPAGCENPICIITIGMAYDERYLAMPPVEVYTRGFAVAHLWCADITPDGPGYDEGLRPLHDLCAHVSRTARRI